MMIRLGEVVKSMSANQNCLSQIKNSQIDVQSHSDLQHSLRELSNASSRTKDANKIIQDLSFRHCQLFILQGGYGRIVHIQPLYEQKCRQLEHLKQSLAQS